MPIIPPIPQVATTPKSITVTLKRWIADEDNPAGESMNYQLVMLDQDGNRIRWRHEQGNLAPHLISSGNEDQIEIQQAFMDIVWALAEGVLPQ